LTLLYVKLEECLIPVRLEQWQNLLMSRIPTDGSKPVADLETAKTAITDLIVMVLAAWDGFLRENYYTGGQLPNDNTELIAYEAGRAMSSLSWDVSVETVPLEQTDTFVQTQGNVASAAAIPATPNRYIQAWQEIFNDQVVILLQHQISAMSAALDAAYTLKHPGVKQPDDRTMPLAPIPDLPSQVIQAVKSSIDYWQRAVKWIAANPNGLRPTGGNIPGSAAWNETMRMALTEQANVWQTLMTGKENLQAYGLESLTQQIMQDVMTDIQKSMTTDFASGVKQAEQAITELTKEAKDAIEVVSNNAAQSLEDLFKSCVKSVWPVLGIIAAVFVLIFALALAMPQNYAVTGAAGGVGLTGIVSATLGYLGLGNLAAKKAAQQTALTAGKDSAKSSVDDKAASSTATTKNAGAGGTLLSRIEGAAQETGDMVMLAFERGYDQMRIELDGLSRSVAITYPLVEFCLAHFVLKSDKDLLTTIIWSGSERTEEIKQVLRAAFGPLAMLIPIPVDE